MSRIMTLARRLRKTPTILRTLRWLRPDQAWAQLRHVLGGIPTPRSASGTRAQLAVDRVSTPFLPPPDHVGGGPGQLELLGVTTEIRATPDWQMSEQGPLFAYHLHQQEYLRLTTFDAGTRAEWIRSWIDGHRRGIGWDPHPISLRLLCWGRLLLTPGLLEEDDEGLRAAMAQSMADQTATLVQGLEVRLQANHLLSNLISIVWSGLLLGGSASQDWRAFAPRLVEELDRQVHPDGGHEERSPMYHALLLENVLDLLNLSLADEERASAGLVESLRGTARRMLGALDVWTRPDGEIALFADAGLGVAASPERLRCYAEALGCADPASPVGVSSMLPQTGYVRLVSGAFDLIASVAGPAPAHQPGHAHCDALAFELSVHGSRLIADTGLYEYRPGPRRDRARATASHGTIEIDGRDQAEVWAAHRIGGRPEVQVLAWNELNEVEASCRGWWRGAPTHRRHIRIDSGAVEVIDTVDGAWNQLVSRFPLAPGWHVELEGCTARVRGTHLESMGEGAAESEAGTVIPAIRFDLPEGFEWRVESQPYYPSFGREENREVLVGTRHRAPSKTSDPALEPAHVLESRVRISC